MAFVGYDVDEGIVFVTGVGVDPIFAGGVLVRLPEGGLGNVIAEDMPVRPAEWVRRAMDVGALPRRNAKVRSKFCNKAEGRYWVVASLIQVKGAV